MGAKQSKRSVDISGKEAEGGGEVAVAGAGGEGRVEQLADADALKPQLNGAAHIQLEEQTDKEKELDSGTPENEKDATTEKEGKEEDEKATEAGPVTNGETEPKAENGESTPTPEDGKKPKKEKVKKKWSLRSISFSRKDKPKQEKKQKEEELKTNGEPEKVPEEAAEAATEAATSEVAEEAKAPAEEKEEKTPETPVTEPITNGTSSPESGAAATPATEEAAPAPSLDTDRPDVKPEPASEPQPEPEQLPVNGLSLEEPKPEIPQLEKIEETKPEPLVAETVEIVPAPEIPKEVCVEQMPLLEPTPPPLPANPPPSSVASFAATTMAPELTDASLANTADAAIAPLSALPETKDILAQSEPPTAVSVTEPLESELPSILKETSEHTPAVAGNNKPEKDAALEATTVTDVIVQKHPDETPKIDIEAIIKETSEVKIEKAVTEAPPCVIETVTAAIPEVEIVKSEAIVIVTPKVESVIEPVQAVIPEVEVVKTEAPEIKTPEIDSAIIKASDTKPTITEIIMAKTETIVTESETVNTDEVENKAETQSQLIVESFVTESELMKIPEPEPEIPDDSSLPPPPSQDDSTNLDEVDEKVEESLKQIPEPITETKEIIESLPINLRTNGVDNIILDETNTEELKKKAKAALGSAVETIECHSAANKEEQPDAPGAVCEEAHLQNGVAAPAERAPSPTEPLPPPPAELCAESEAPAPHTPQEALPVSDKLADLIPEVPDVPELNTETLQETVTDVAVSN